MAGDDCSEYICSSGKDEAQLNALMQAASGSPSGQRYKPDRLPRSERPLNVFELGWSTWPILHRMSLSYPKNPTED